LPAGGLNGNASAPCIPQTDRCTPAAPRVGIQGALAIPFNPPAVQGLGNFGGFTFEVEGPGRNSVQQIANTAYALIGEETRAES